MSVLPELFVSLCFLQCGAWMGFLIYMLPEHYEPVLVGPHIIAMASAGLAAIIMAGTKHLYGRVRFYHMLLIAAGSASLLGCGLAFILHYEDPTVGVFFGAIGHGMVYVTGLCYVHFRSKDDNFRVTRIGLCHLVHMGGMCLYVHSTSQLGFNGPDIVYRAGWVITAGAILALCVLLLNELLSCMGAYNYKKCRDPVLEDANDISDHFKSTLGLNDAASLTQQPSHKRQFLISALALKLKLINITFNYHIFLYFTHFTIHYLLQDYDPYYNYHYIMYYFGLLGVIIGVIASTFLNYKLIVMKVLGAAFLALIVGIPLLTTGHYGMAGISFWLMYLSLGIGSFGPDVAILEVSNIRMTELMLAKGYIMEHTVVSTIIFLFQRHPHMILTGDIVSTGWASGGTFAGLFLILLIIFTIFFPQTHRKGLITIQYIALYNREDKPEVPIKPVTADISMPS